MLCDCHIHTNWSADCDTPIKDQIEKAIALSMPCICITDHHDFGTAFGGTPNLFTIPIDRYLENLSSLKKQYKDRIEILAGIELGMQIHIKPYLNELVKRYSFDYVIGSSHFIDSMDVYYPDYFATAHDPESEKRCYEHYFTTTLHRIEALDCFDALGHLDYIVRYGPFKNRFYSYDSFREFIDPILEELIKKGKALECNSGGLKNGLGQPNPCEDIIKRYRELGGKLITVGSDAHTSDVLGYDFDTVSRILLRCGFKEYAVYKSGKPVMFSLQ